MRAAFTVAFIVAACLTGRGALAAGPQAPAGVSYDEFITLSSEARHERLRQMRPEAIAAFKRTHAERWFAAHGSRLSRAQIEVFTEALQFITTGALVRADDAEAMRREEALRYKLACVLGVENTRRAFVIQLPPPSDSPRGWRSVADEWVSWFSDCVVP